VLKAKVALDPSGGLEVPMRPPYMPVITERLREAATLYEKAGARSLAAEVRTLSLPSFVPVQQTHRDARAHAHTQTHTWTQAHTHAYAQTYAHTQTRTQTHTLLGVCVFPPDALA
jgi:hypothetical protein